MFIKIFPEIEKYRSIGLIIITFTFIFPLGLINNISKLSITSSLTVFSISYIVLIICIQTPWYINNYASHYSNNIQDISHNNEDNSMEITISNVIFNNFEKMEKSLQNNQINYSLQEASVYNIINFFDFKQAFSYQLIFFSAYCSILFCLNFHINILNVTSTISNPNFKKGKFLVKHSLIFVSLLLSLVTFFGYLTVPIHTPTLIYNRYKLFKNDYMIEFGKYLLTFSIVFKIPICFNGLKQSLVGLIYDNSSITELPIITNIIFTFVFFSFSTFVSITFPKIDDILGFISGIYSTSYTITFPLFLMYSFEYCIERKRLKGEFEKHNNGNIIEFDDKTNIDVISRYSQMTFSVKDDKKSKIHKGLLIEGFKPKVKYVLKAMIKEYGILLIIFMIISMIIGYTTAILIIRKILFLKQDGKK